MNENATTVLVTGGLGFIGSHFVELLLKRGYRVINVDKKTYAIREDTSFEANPNYRLIVKDICDLKELPKADYLVNMAAESHVDNSIANSSPFFQTNVSGVYHLLELVRTCSPETRPVFIQISTDEVYGDIETGSFKESDRLKPSSPYSATKAAADQLVLGWARTYGLKVRIHRASNNYGYGQRAEKLIPRSMKFTIKGVKTPIHGSGLYKREWTWVVDNCDSILRIMEKGVNGEIYNVSAGEELTNLDVVQKVLRVMGRPDDFYEFVPDRLGQDTRYSIDTTKIRALGWQPTMTLDRYLPICKQLNEERTKAMGPGRKKKLLAFLGLEKLIQS